LRAWQLEVARESVKWWDFWLMAIILHQTLCFIYVVSLDILL